MNASTPPSLAAQLTSAAPLETPPDAREFLMRALKLEGMACMLDEDRDIAFRLEEFSYCLRVFDSDPEFAQLVLPHFLSVDAADDLAGLLVLADRVSSRVKNVKFFSARSGDQVALHASADFLVPDTRQLASVLPRAAAALACAVRDFRTLRRLM